MCLVLLQGHKLHWVESAKWKSLSTVWLCDPMDYTVHRILQVRILDWVAIPFFSGSSTPRDQTGASFIVGRFFTSWATREAHLGLGPTQMTSFNMNYKDSVSPILRYWIFPSGSDGKKSTCNTGDLGSIPVWGRSPGGGHGHPLQYSCLENPMDRGTWWATVHGVAKSWTQLSD